jgi:predicted TIM-barrel fold metal-dependent hydrolase
LLAVSAAAAARAALAKASQPATKVNFAVPAGACDCHTHIFAPAKYPYAAGRTYTPEAALPNEMASLHKALGIARVVIVNPSVYGTDNGATVYGIKARGKTARGVAVIGAANTDRDLRELAKAGICGIRLNMATTGPVDPAAARERLQSALMRVQPLGWHIQIYANGAVVAAVKDLVMGSPVPVVFDHFAGAQAAAGLGQPGFSELLEMLRAGKAYVKVSGAYRASSQGPGYADVRPLAKAIIAANPDRVIWGTDWPHPDTTQLAGRKATDLAPLLQIDDGALLNLLPAWAPDAATRRKILVDNPARLYGF